MKIVLLGSGNVATHLGRSFKMAGQDIVQVYSRELENAYHLADSLAAEAVEKLEDITSTADLYIIAVKDDAIREVAAGLSLTDQLVIHTSGTTDMNILDGISDRIGVFYPLQTFSKSKAVDFRQIPIAIEGNTEEVTSTLKGIADRLSEKVIELNSLERRTLHIAAVFASNFSNHMYALASRLLKTQNLSFDVLRPLILETALKVQTNDPADMQTGPAVRKDYNTLEKQKELLLQDESTLELYEKISQSIINYDKQG
ncbi:Rossmann-like and DUF2520 domain-containing protein [Daejeonella oryzae]|uniref:Rossmann-like and DUF2520 domain-containing protein n=1 Tax=Daejeonella oryzae TaxID=1122943 RepID=UPI0004135E25|nr:Rossmann-like and DUF2520 domain-containing protein [Daejeonella oryzae]